MPQALHRLVAQAQGDHHEQHRIRECGQNTGAVVAIGLFGIGWARGPAHCKPRNPQRRDIREVVHGVVQQRYRMAQRAAGDFHDDETQRRRHGPSQGSFTPACMDVHRSVRIFTGATVPALLDVHVLILCAPDAARMGNEPPLGSLTRARAMQIDSRGSAAYHR